jgi:hypothetical protein
MTFDLASINIFFVSSYKSYVSFSSIYAEPQMFTFGTRVKRNETVIRDLTSHKSILRGITHADRSLLAISKKSIMLQ